MSANVAVTAALELAIQLLAHSQQISQIVAEAQANGQSALTDEQWGQVESAYTAAREHLVKAINGDSTSGQSSS